LTGPRRATYARIVVEEITDGRTWRRRRIYAGVALAVGALLLAMLLVDPPDERALRAERERRLDALRSIGSIRVRLPVVPSALADELYDDWELRARDRECALVRRAAESDERIEREERARIRRVCAAAH
jgi:hypothetical protein